MFAYITFYDQIEDASGELESENGVDNNDGAQASVRFSIPSVPKRASSLLSVDPEAEAVKMAYKSGIIHITPQIIKSNNGVENEVSFMSLSYMLGCNQPGHAIWVHICYKYSFDSAIHFVTSSNGPIGVKFTFLCTNSIQTRI